MQLDFTAGEEKRMKILVVDDEMLLVKGIKFNLESEGYSVECCYDGETAVATSYHINSISVISTYALERFAGSNHSSSTIPFQYGFSLTGSVYSCHSPSIFTG